MTKRVLISAGEASGDLHAANLIKALLNIEPEIKVRAMGANKLRAAGAKVVVDCTEIAVVGLFEVLANYKKIKTALDTMRAEIKQNPPDLLILVDYQEFNLKLAKTAKQQGVKVLFYISPQVWAWRPKRVHKIGKYVDMMAVLFPFEEKFYQEAGVPVTFVGHPLVDEVKPSKTKNAAITEYKLNPEQKVIGLFPGSRLGEIKRILPLQLNVAETLRKSEPGVQFILPIASSLRKADMMGFVKKHKSLEVKIIQSNVYDVMQVTDAIITASGTATLEIALMEIPSVITYKISPLSYLILKRMVNIDKVGLVNIVAEKDIVKEFIQDKAKPSLIAAEIIKILKNSTYRQNMILQLKKVKARLGKKGGSQNVAELAYSMLYSKSKILS